jgi:hypothetical protein
LREGEGKPQYQEAQVITLVRFTRALDRAASAHRARREHDESLSDPRVAAEHEIAISRSLDQSGVGCRFCS